MKKSSIVSWLIFISLIIYMFINYNPYFNDGQEKTSNVILDKNLLYSPASQVNESNDSKMQNNKTKILIIGIDGMDPRISEALIRNDNLPNFKKLAENGTFVSLGSTYPPQSPVAWASMATGVNPGKHNIFDFIRRNPENYMPELSLSKSDGGSDYESYIKADPFWRITTKAGVPTTIIRWPITFPPEEVVGHMLSGLGVPDIKGFFSGYKYYTDKEIEDKSSPEKIVKINVKDDEINTFISGPKKKKSGEIVDVNIPVKIRLLDDHIELNVDGHRYIVKEKEWSKWIRGEFSVGLFNKVNGIFKVYLTNIKPFEMYLTTIQIDPKKPVVPISFPGPYSSDLADEIGLYYTLGMPEETDGYVDDRIDTSAFLAQVQEIEDERDKMFWKEFNVFNEKERGIFAFVYDSSDRIQHVFWNEKVLDTDDGKISLKQAVLDYYTNKDKFIGKVLEKIDEKTLLLIVSDHGITSFERSFSMNNWLVENGYMTLTQELKEGEEGALFRYVDWSKTQAYSLGFNSLYINVNGREGQGIVSDESVNESSERERIVNEIILKLEAVIDNKIGKKIIHKAYRREEIHSGDYVKNAPDIMIGFKPGYRMSWQTAIGGFGNEFIEDNLKKWSGDHLVDPSFVPGVLFSNAELSKEADLMDIAPTVLETLGLKIKDDVDGKSLLKSKK